MKNKIRVKVFDEVQELDDTITYEELAEKYKDKFKYSIIATKVNNKFVFMKEKVKNGADITFFDLTNRDANRIYQDTLIYIMIYSIISLYGEESMIYVKHSIDKGLYVELNRKINEEDISMILQRMRKVVEANLPIERIQVRKEDAIRYFLSKGLRFKSSVLRYTNKDIVTLYNLEDMYDIYYSELAPSTAHIDRFDIKYLSDKGFILMFPTNYEPDIIRPYVHHPQLFLEFQENAEWAEIMNIESASDLNKLVQNGYISDLIRTEETLQSNRLLDIAKRIYGMENIKIVLISGPSSSGKTTSSLKLSNFLRSFGINPVRISMDDYFLPRSKTPRRPDGHYDFENITAVDLDLFNCQIKELLEGKEVCTPVFDFIKGEPEFVRNLKMGLKDVLIIEGIHALNPLILENIDKKYKFKLYVSPATTINIDNHNRIPTTDNRLIRRLVRDSRTRGKGVEESLIGWAMVREGEEEFVFPYQDEADATFNTAYFYELGVLRLYAEPLLYSVSINSPAYAEAQRLIYLLENFLTIPNDSIAEDSVIREFIGGSCYNVD